jgi:hypothetical protein
MEREVESTFEPAKHLVNINGKGEYLEVKWRLVWLRDAHPDAVIETELVRLEEADAVFKARVSIPGGGSATGWGSESAGDFRDFIEKAETKAIGRALAALGFGTQFCHDHDFGATEGRIVDTPVSIHAGRPRHVGGNGFGGNGRGDQAAQAAAAAATQRATERQVKFIHAIAREAGLDELELAEWSQELYGMGVDELNRRDASALIEALQRRRNEVA